MDHPAAVERGDVRAEAAAGGETGPAEGEGRPDGTCARPRPAADWTDAIVRDYGKERRRRSPFL